MSVSNQTKSQPNVLADAFQRFWLTIRTPHFMLLFATGFLVAFVLLTQLEASASLLMPMFLFSQVMVILFAWIVVRHGVFDGKDFDENQEFGYEDYDVETGRFTRTTGEVMEQLKDSE